MLALVGLLIAVGLVHHVAVLVAAYVGTLVLAAASRLPIGFFVKRVWLFIPIFTGIVVLPATLNVVTPGEIVVPLPVRHLGLTQPGADGGRADHHPGRHVDLAGPARHPHDALGAAAVGSAGARRAARCSCS